MIVWSYRCLWKIKCVLFFFLFSLPNSLLLLKFNDHFKCEVLSCFFVLRLYIVTLILKMPCFILVGTIPQRQIWSERVFSVLCQYPLCCRLIDMYLVMQHWSSSLKINLWQPQPQLCAVHAYDTGLVLPVKACHLHTAHLSANKVVHTLY